MGGTCSISSTEFRAHGMSSVSGQGAGRVLSNKRLKLAGADRSKGSGVLCAGAHELSFNSRHACGRVARSLSAVR